MKVRFDLSKVKVETAKRLKAYQRNKLYPIFLAFSDASEETIKRKKRDFVKRLNELTVNAAISEKDEKYYQSLVRILESGKKIAQKDRKEALRIIQLLIKRMKAMTQYLAKKS